MPVPPIARTREIRNLSASIEVRAEAENGGNTLIGYASRFNEPINPYFYWPEFSEIVHPDCFTRTLKEMPDVRALFNHDSSILLGRVSAGTLRLTIDATGLAFEVDLPDTQAGRDVKVSVARRDITGCSIGFCVNMDEVVSDRETGKITRTLLDVDLFEITPACTFPANPATEVSLRSLVESRINARPNLDLIRLYRTRSRR